MYQSLTGINILFEGGAFNTKSKCKIDGWEINFKLKSNTVNLYKGETASDLLLMSCINHITVLQCCWHIPPLNLFGESVSSLILA